MKIAMTLVLALVAVVGICQAYYASPYMYPQQRRSSGMGGLWPLLILLCILPFLFNKSSNNDQIILINSTLTG